MKDVHTEHCCLIHGCKYCDPECTVVTSRAPQSFPCEACEEMDTDHIGHVLDLAIDAIEGLADQQAVYDDWYLPPLSIIKDTARKLKNE